MTTPMPEWLEKKMKRFSELYAGGADDEPSVNRHKGFEAGFPACHALMAEREAKLVEELEHWRAKYIGCQDHYIPRTAKLFEALKANMDWIGPPQTNHPLIYDSQREQAWKLGRQAIADVGE